jgi:hypothetical protein
MKEKNDVFKETWDWYRGDKKRPVVYTLVKLSILPATIFPYPVLASAASTFDFIAQDSRLSWYSNILEKPGASTL